MGITINEDEFEDDSERDSLEVAPEVYSIVYGARGWTDSLDSATLELLLNIGAIELDRSSGGGNWVAHVYVSKKGILPK